MTRPHKRWTAAEIGKAVGRTKRHILHRSREEGWPHALDDPNTGELPTKLFDWEGLPPDLRHAIEHGVPLSAIPPAQRRTLRAQTAPAGVATLRREIAALEAKLKRLRKALARAES